VRSLRSWNVSTFPPLPRPDMLLLDKLDWFELRESGRCCLADVSKRAFRVGTSQEQFFQGHDMSTNVNKYTRDRQAKVSTNASVCFSQKMSVTHLTSASQLDDILNNSKEKLTVVSVQPSATFTSQKRERSPGYRFSCCLVRYPWSRNSPYLVKH
jgi:hypothetical protein